MEHVALGSIETVVIPGETQTVFANREERIARHVRDWIEQADARIRAPECPGQRSPEPTCSCMLL